MTSDRQRDANRRNARRSTGPITPEGRAVSSQNARRHGVLSDHVTSPDEDRELFNSVLLGLIDDFEPCSEMELVLVERLAVLVWRERRLVRSERAALSESSRGISLGTDPISRSSISIHDQLLIGRYQTMLTNQVSSTIHQLRLLQQSRSDAETIYQDEERGEVGSRDLPPPRPRTRSNPPPREWRRGSENS